MDDWWSSRRSGRASVSRKSGDATGAPPASDQSLRLARLRPAFSCRLGHPLAPNLRRGRHALHRVRRAHDDARGRDGPRVHCPRSRRAASLARPTRRRRLNSPPFNARHVAPGRPLSGARQAPDQRPTTAESGLASPRFPAARPSRRALVRHGRLTWTALGLIGAGIEFGGRWSGSTFVVWRACIGGALIFAAGITFFVRATKQSPPELPTPGTKTETE